MRKNKFPFSHALNNAISGDNAWQCKHYTGRRVRKLQESGTALVEDVEAPVSKMRDSSEAHDLMESRSLRFRAVSHGMKLLARKAQRRNSATTSVREEISQHSPTLSRSVGPTPRSRSQKRVGPSGAKHGGGSHPQATMDQEWAKELREIRRMVEFLVHGERKLDVKTDVAASSKTRSAKPASEKPSRTAPKS